jgi:uncharacterized protein (TIGR03067 family)
MWRVVLAGVVAASASAAPRLKDPPQTAIIGDWVAVGSQKDGVTVTFAPGTIRFAFEAGGRWVQSPGRSETIGWYLVDASASLAAIDMFLPPTRPTDRPVPGLGIFRVNGDTLEICVRSGPGERPADFAAGEGSGATLMTFKRVKRKE